MESMRALWIALPLSLFAACGGQSEKDDDGTGGSAGTAAGAKGGDAGTSGDAGASGTKGGSSGSSTGGSAGTSGKGGTAGVGGADGGAFAGGASGFGGTGVGADGGTSGTAGDAGTAGVGGTGMACCKAAAVCPEGATAYAPGTKCPLDNTCEELTVCCNTILCATPTAMCNALPLCDEGDSQVDECPADASCYSRTLCGSTILCADLTCDPADEYNRKYVSTGSCDTIDFECDGATTPFFNDCGCGCEQDSSCPVSIDCSPGAQPRPECSDEELLTRCPYTVRAL